MKAEKQIYYWTEPQKLLQKTLFSGHYLSDKSRKLYQIL